MLISNYITPVMYIDPNGESALMLMIIFTASVLALTLVGTSSTGEEAASNVSVSGGVSPNGGLGIEFLGMGLEVAVSQMGYTLDGTGNVSSIENTSMTIGFLGAEYSKEDGKYNSVSFSCFVFYGSLELNDITNVNSWELGLSFSASASLGGGSAFESYDIDFLGLIVEQFERKEDK